MDNQENTAAAQTLALNSINEKEQTPIDRKFKWPDGIYVLANMVIGLAIFLIAYLCSDPHSLAALAGFAWTVLFVGIGFIPYKNRRLWKYLFSGIIFSLDKQAKAPRDVYQKMTAFFQQPSGAGLPNDDDTQAPAYITTTTSDLNGEIVVHYRLEWDDFAKDDSDIYARVMSLNNFFKSWLRYDEKKGLAFDLSFFQSENVDYAPIKRNLKKAQANLQKKNLIFINRYYEEFYNQGGRLWNDPTETLQMRKEFQDNPLLINPMNRYAIFSIRCRNYRAYTEHRAQIEGNLGKVGKFTRLTRFDYEQLMTIYTAGLWQKPAVHDPETVLDFQARRHTYNINQMLDVRTGLGSFGIIKEIIPHPTYLEIHTGAGESRYITTMSINEWPNHVPIGWMNYFQQDTALVTMKFKYDKARVYNRKLRASDAQKNRAFLKINRNLQKNPNIYTQAQVQAVMDASVQQFLEREDNRFCMLNMNILIMFSAEDPKLLMDKRQRMIDDLVNNLQISPKDINYLIFNQLGAYQSVFPNAKMAMSRSFYNDETTFTSYLMAKGYSFQVPMVVPKSGIPVGVTQDGQRIVYLDIFSSTGYQMIGTGMTGAGKTFREQGRLMASAALLPKQPKQIIFDPNNEYGAMTVNALDGFNITMGSNLSTTRWVPEDDVKKKIPYYTGDVNNMLAIRKNSYPIFSYRKLSNGSDQMCWKLIDSRMRERDFIKLLNSKENAEKFNQTQRRRLTELFQVLWSMSVVNWKINIFRVIDLYGKHQDAEGHDIYPTYADCFQKYLEFLQDFFTILFPSMTSAQQNIMYQATIKAYEMKQIYLRTSPDGFMYCTEDSNGTEDQAIEYSEFQPENAKNRNYPVFNDFYQALLKVMQEEPVENRKVYQREYLDLRNEVRKFVTYVDERGIKRVGVYAHLWDKDTRIDIDDIPAICFNMEDMKEHLDADYVPPRDVLATPKTIAFAQITLLIALVRNQEVKNREYNQHNKQEDGRFIFNIIDEAHNFLKVPAVNSLFKALFKEGRKYSTSTELITQELSDIMDTPGGKGIYNNTEFVLMMTMSDNAVDDVDSHFSKRHKFTNTQAEFLVNPTHQALDNPNAQVPAGYLMIATKQIFRQMVIVVVPRAICFFFPNYFYKVPYTIDQVLKSILEEHRLPAQTGEKPIPIGAEYGNEYWLKIAQDTEEIYHRNTKGQDDKTFDVEDALNVNLDEPGDYAPGNPANPV